MKSIRNPSTDDSVRAFPGKGTIMKCGKYTAAAGVICADGRHDFIRPYPFRCRKCGLSCTCGDEQISKYMGSFFDGSTYRWNARLRWKRIAAFSLSTGIRPVYRVDCDFSRLRVQRCLRSKDGWMQPEFPENFFAPREIKLCGMDRLKLKRFLMHCDFSAWETPARYAENWIMGACGFHVDRMFTCQFANGRKFICLKPEREEFEQLVSLVREITGKAFWEPEQT